MRQYLTVTWCFTIHRTISRTFAFHLCLGGYARAPSPWLADAAFTLSFHIIFPNVSLCIQIAPLYKDTSQITLGSTLTTSFQLQYLCETPSQIKSHSGVLGS